MALVLMVDDADIRDLSTFKLEGLSMKTVVVDDSAVRTLLSRARA